MGIRWRKWVAEHLCALPAFPIHRDAALEPKSTIGIPIRVGISICDEIFDYIERMLLLLLLQRPNVINLQNYNAHRNFAVIRNSDLSVEIPMNVGIYCMCDEICDHI